MTIDISDLAKEINKTLVEYTDEVVEKVEKSADKRTKEGVKLLKQRSPKDTGEYARSWTRKKRKTGYVIHNKKYQLTHLLEKGHAKVGGGRVQAYPHIAPVEKQIVEGYIKDVEEAIKR